MRRLADLSPRQRLILGGAGAGGLVVVIILILLIANATSDAAVDQPIAFNHNKHVNIAENGIQCQFCHTGVYTSPVAGIPSVEKCMGCHGLIATDKPEIVKLTDYWEKQEPIPWQRVNEQPSFVYFNHSSHISSGVTCGACHGDVGNMTVAEKVVDMNMGFCLDCHTQQENKDELIDCVVCHR